MSTTDHENAETCLHCQLSQVVQKFIAAQPPGTLLAADVIEKITETLGEYLAVTYVRQHMDVAHGISMMSHAAESLSDAFNRFVEGYAAMQGPTN